MTTPITITAHPPIYPYLITRVSPAFYHVIVLPLSDFDTLKQIAIRQEELNQLPTNLVLNDHTALCPPDEEFYGLIPGGGTLITDRLKSCLDASESQNNDPTLADRMDVLAKFIEEQPKECLFGDLTKGARPATSEELVRLSSAPLRPGRLPRGLEFCEACGMFRGECLDTLENTRNQVIVVHCECENTNRCGRCHELLYNKKLNANYYDPRDNKIWHVPGFSGLGHVCER